MSYPADQTRIPEQYALTEPASRFLAGPFAAPPLRLVAETGAVAFCAVGAVALLNIHRAQDVRWLAIPGILIAAALVPAWADRREFPSLGLDLDHLQSAARIVGRVCLYTFPTVLLGLWLLTLAHVPLPLRPATGGQQNWFTWLLYQFLYVAVAEEVFFRGYIQANVAQFLRGTGGLSGSAQQHIAILTSAACFACAHVAVQGRITSLVVFLPGLVLAWLFARTQSLLAPILFHGLANVSYGVMAAALT